MSWRNLLQTENDSISLPWLGESKIRSRSTTWTLIEPRPAEHGWYKFVPKGRNITAADKSDLDIAQVNAIQTGYLIGDRLALDTQAIANLEPAQIAKALPKVHLIDPGLERFQRIQAGKIYEDGPLIFVSLAMPLGPEQEAADAYLDSASDINNIKGVTPALANAFKLETWQRAETERRRVEIERLRKLEEERLAAETRRQEMFKRIGDGEGRREIAQQDFGEAAKAALAVSGADLLDWRKIGNRDEYEVKFRLERDRYACTCNSKLRIQDSGICLDSHRGFKGDKLFTLESLPGVILQAKREGKLVVFRRA